MGFIQKKIKKLNLLIVPKFIIVFVCLKINSQTNDINNIQYGAVIKATIDLNWLNNNPSYSNFNISFIGGAGIHPFDIKFLYPSIHAGFLLYNRGDLLSSYENGFWNSTSLNFIFDFTINGGLYRNNINFQKRLVPLYHFSDIAPNPLQNPFQNSLGLGTNFIFNIRNENYTSNQSQRVGFTNLMIDRRFQIMTHNDGSIWGKLGLGDRLDRYFTGGGVIAYHLDSKNEINNLEASFNKFTTHEDYAFDTAYLLQLDFIPFKNKKSHYYNKNRFRFSATSLKNNGGINLTFHNTDKDPQDKIHFIGDDTYFPDIFYNQRKYWNELKRIGIGGFWFDNSHKFEN